MRPKVTYCPELVLDGPAALLTPDGEKIKPVNHVEESEDMYLEFVRMTQELSLGDIDDVKDLQLRKPCRARVVRRVESL